MSKTMELLAIFEERGYPARYAEAKAFGNCIRCGRRAEDFSSLLTRLEYEISALCQKCQDECFKG